MRLLQLNPNGSDESALDLHPAITVVRGLGGRGRELVVHAVSALPAGRDPGCGGLVEAHGIMLDLNADTLAMLDLVTELDVVVRPSDIPVAGRPATATVSARPTLEQFLEGTPPGRYPELDAARQRQAEAGEALALLQDAARRSQATLAAAQVRAADARRALEAARAALAGPDPADDTTSSLDDDAEREVRQVELDAEIERLTDEAARIERSLAELSSIDTRPIQVLVDAIHEPAPVEWVPSERAAVLADEYVRLQAEVAVLEDRLEARGMGPGSAMRELEEARAEVQAAERGMAKPEVSDEDAALLEAVHEEVLEAERKMSGFGKRGGQKRLEEALERQQEILDRVGFPTWSSYIMGATLLSIDPVAEQRLENARFALDAAEAHWAEITGLIEADPEHRALLDELEAVYLEAYDLLGGDEPEDLEHALRTLKVPRREVTIEELVDALAYQLELVGLAMSDGPLNIDYVVVVAEAFLAEAAGINDRVHELRTEQLAVRTALDEARRSRAALDEETIAAATIDLTDLEPPSEAEVAGLEAELAAAEEDEQAERDACEAREALVDAATQVEAVATSRLIKLAHDLAGPDGLAADPVPGMLSPPPGAGVGEAEDDNAAEYYLLARLAALRNVSFAGSVPLVLDDALGDLSAAEARALLDRLERMADTVQIVYLSDDPSVVGWAEGLGFERAAVVDAPSVYA